MNISNLIVVWFSSLTLRQVALSYLWNAAEKFYGLSKYPRFDFEWTKSCYVHFDIKLGLKCTDCYCYVLVYGNYLYKKHVEFFSNTWGSSLLSNFFSRLFFCCNCYCKFFFFPCCFALFMFVVTQLYSSRFSWLRCDVRPKYHLERRLNPPHSSPSKIHS